MATCSLDIEERVAKHEFDVIIYGEIMKSHRDDPQIKFGKMQKYGDWSLPPNLYCPCPHNSASF